MMMREMPTHDAGITNLEGGMNAAPPAPGKGVMHPGGLQISSLNADLSDEGRNCLCLPAIGLKGKRNKLQICLKMMFAVMQPLEKPMPSR